MVIEYTGYPAYSLGDINRFLAPWVKQYGNNLKVGDPLTKQQITVDLGLGTSTFSTSKKVPMDARLVVEQCGSGGQRQTTWNITQHGVDFIQRFFAVQNTRRGGDEPGDGGERVSISKLERYRKVSGEGNFIKQRFYLDDEQKRILLRIALMEQPGTGGGWRSYILTTMRLINVTQGKFYPSHGNFCSSHNGNTDWLDVVGCNDCFGGEITEEGVRNYYEIHTNYTEEDERYGKVRTVRDNVPSNIDSMIDLGLVVKISEKEVAFTEKGSMIYQLLETREWEYPGYVFVCSGPWTNWQRSITYADQTDGIVMWGSVLGDVSDQANFEKLKVGDLVFVMQENGDPGPFSGRHVFGVGRVVWKREIENVPGNIFWPNETKNNFYRGRWGIKMIRMDNGNDHIAVPFGDVQTVTGMYTQQLTTVKGFSPVRANGNIEILMDRFVIPRHPELILNPENGEHVSYSDEVERLLRL